MNRILIGWSHNRYSHIRFSFKLGLHDAWYVFVMCNARMCKKQFVESGTYASCGNVPVGWKNLWFDECAVYWHPLHDESHSNTFSHSPNANIRRISINNRLDEITNHRYSWSICADVCQFTANLANQMRRMNEWHIHSNHSHFFIHTMRESWHITNTYHASCGPSWKC